jgi:hypothetical protein
LVYRGWRAAPADDPPDGQLTVFDAIGEAA